MEKFTLNEIKVAVINRDIKKLTELASKTPAFSSEKEAKELIYYINRAADILQEEKDKISKEMKEIKKLQKFNASNTQAKDLGISFLN
jgi:esterase/lipase